jgi:DNA-binding transcriptional LysR family regulator
MSLPPETRLTLGQLRTFLAVAATGSVRAAADQLVVTQPAVSSALAAVRKQVGVALVMRDGRGLRLTPAGEALAERARAALALSTRRWPPPGARPIPTAAGCGWRR